MTYDTLFEQIKTVPQEYLADIEKYVGYVLYRYKKIAKRSCSMICQNTSAV